MSTIQEVLKCINCYQTHGYNSYFIQAQRKAGFGKDEQYELRHRLATELAKDVERLENTAQGWADLVRRWKEFLSDVSDKNCMSGALTKMIDEVQAMERFQQALQAQEQVQHQPATAVNTEPQPLVVEAALSSAAAGSPHSNDSDAAAGGLTDDDADVAPSLRAPCQHVLDGVSDLPSPVGGSPLLFSTSVSPLPSHELSPSFSLTDSDQSDSDSSDADLSADEDAPDAVAQRGPVAQNRRLPISGLGVMAVLLGQVDAASALLGPAARAAFLHCNRMTDCLDRHRGISPVVEGDSEAVAIRRP